MEESPSKQNNLVAPSLDNQSPSPKNNLTLLLSIILIVVVGVGGIILGKYLSVSKLETPPIPLPTTTQPKPTSLVDQTADWKTYQNKEYGFEFKYPNILDYEDKTLELNTREKDYYFIEIFKTSNYEIQTNPLGGYLSGKGISYRLDLTKNKCVDLEKTGQNKWGYKNYHKGILNGSPTQEYEVTTDGANNNKTSNIDYKNGCLSFVTQYGDDYVINNKGEKQFDQILATFKFLDSTSAIPADWKKYTNTKYGYSINYPPDLKITTMTDQTGHESVFLSFPDVINSQIIVGWHEKNKNTDFVSWVNSSLKIFDKYQFSPPRQLTIDSRPAISVDSNINNQSFFYTVFILKDNTNIADLSLTNLSSINSPLKSIFDQILSTFKFLP